MANVSGLGGTLWEVLLKWDLVPDYKQTNEHKLISVLFQCLHEKFPPKIGSFTMKFEN